MNLEFPTFPAIGWPSAPAHKNSAGPVEWGNNRGCIKAKHWYMGCYIPDEKMKKFVTIPFNNGNLEIFYKTNARQRGF
jgi:hypothetical protein